MLRFDSIYWKNGSPYQVSLGIDSMLGRFIDIQNHNDIDDPYSWSDRFQYNKQRMPKDVFALFLEIRTTIEDCEEVNCQ
ncbi:MAG: hypothetical protein ACXAAH_01605 [Promethearchaeota archaeon]|jgi:hypothetical protein